MVLSKCSNLKKILARALKNLKKSKKKKKILIFYLKTKNTIRTKKQRKIRKSYKYEHKTDTLHFVLTQWRGKRHLLCSKKFSCGF